MRYKSKGKKTSKICAEHFKTRCYQRIGIALDQNDLKHKMESGELKFLYKQSNTKTHWQMKIPGSNKNVVLVYDKLRKVFVTILNQYYES